MNEKGELIKVGKRMKKKNKTSATVKEEEEILLERERGEEQYH